MNLVIFGPPGAGKGTQSGFITKKFKLYQLSTGELLRTEIKNKTTLTGSLKYPNLKEVNKVFALFITHNYGSVIYELCNFLKYLSQNNLPFYNIMVIS